MKKILLLLPILMICACDNAKTYIVGETAICTGLNETDENPVFCTDKSGKPINGIVKQYYQNGNIWREMAIKNGIENGVEREYYENGNIHVVANVVDGKTDGLSELYNESGELYMQLFWSNGEVKTMKVFDKKGNVLEAK